MKKFYKIVAELGDDSVIDFNAFVNNPAHMKGFISFGKGKTIPYTFSEDGEKRIVTGVMISADTQIFRDFGDGNESYVSFDAHTIDVLKKKFFSLGFAQNVNQDHDASKAIQGATLVESYTIFTDNPNYPKAPAAFERQNLRDGSWIASYWVTDDAIWSKVKDGTFNGFSVEGFLDKVEVKINNKNKMNKTKKTIAEYLGFAKAKDSFTMATTADGVELFYDGELAEGTVIFLEEAMENLAPEGENQLTLKDGTVKIVTLDAQGVVLTVADVEAEGEELSAEDLRQEIAEAMQKQTAAIGKEIDERFKKLEAKFEALTKSEKFAHTGKKAAGTSGKTWKNINK